MNEIKSRRFQFIRQLSAGTFGDVYLCKELQPNVGNRLVIIKLLKSKWKEHQEIIEEIRTNVRLLGSLHHRNIITILDLTAIDSRTAIVMEYFEGISLAMIIAKMRHMRRRMPLRVCLEIIAAVAGALDAAYNKTVKKGGKPLRVIHRNIKPSNIMVNSDGLMKVLDFGFSPTDFEGRESQTRELQFRSSSYMAPERLFFGPQTSASDIYSLGVALFECICARSMGQASAQEDTHQEFVEVRIQKLMQALKIGPAIRSELESILRSSLHYNAVSRLSAVEFAQRTRNLSRSVPGPDLVTWAERAIPHFQAQQSNPIDALDSLKGSIWAEDSTIIRIRQNQPPETNEVDGETIRRGALAEFIGGDSNDSGAEVEDTGTDVMSKHTHSSAEENLSEASPVSSVFVRVSDKQPSVTADQFLSLQQKVDADEATAEVTLIENSASELDLEDDAQLLDDSRPIDDFVPKPTPIAPQAKTNWLWYWALGGGALVSMILAGLGVGYFFFDSPSTVPIKLSSKAVETTPVVEKTAKPQEDNQTASGDSSTIVFVSAVEETKKMRAKCGDQKSKSQQGEVSVDLQEAKACQVSISLQDKTKRMVELTDVTAGRYLCFQQGKDSCVREK